MACVARHPGWPALVAGLLALASAGRAAIAQGLSDRAQEEMDAANIEEKRGEPIALDAVFTDQDGREVEIGDYFDGQRPVVLVLGYFDCPLVCPVVFNNAQGVFNDLAWTLGKEYRALTVSFDHRDTPAKAASHQSASLAGVDRATGPDAWPFLTGDAEQIGRLCDSLGWRYRFLPRTGEFSHPTAIIVLSPDGKISNYLYGVKYKERQLRLSLIDASEGKIGGVFDRIILRCYHYDPTAGSYVIAAQTVMSIAGLVTVVLLVAVVVFLLRLDRRRTRAHAQQEWSHA